MAYGGGEYTDITLPAAADFSTHQYKFIIADANGRGTIATTAVGPYIGILQNKPDAADKPARIRVHGISKLVAGAALNENDMICSTAVGGFGTATAASAIGTFCGAIALAAVGGSTDIADVLVTHFIV